MTISEVSNKYNLSAETLRYYERVCVIPPVNRNENGIRDYTEVNCNWVNFIKCMRDAGLSIESLIEYLICVDGEGWYQEEGKKPQSLKVGDVVTIPANVKHWHGAAPNSWFSHLAIEVDGEETSNKWLEPVSDEEYNKLQ